jgi:hypothetical protein
LDAGSGGWKWTHVVSSTSVRWREPRGRGSTPSVAIDMPAAVGRMSAADGEPGFVDLRNHGHRARSNDRASAVFINLGVDGAARRICAVSLCKCRSLRLIGGHSWVVLPRQPCRYWKFPSTVLVLKRPEATTCEIRPNLRSGLTSAATVTRSERCLQLRLDGDVAAVARRQEPGIMDSSFPFEVRRQSIARSRRVRCGAVDPQKDGSVVNNGSDPNWRDISLDQPIRPDGQGQSGARVAYSRSGRSHSDLRM